jgi:selenocysteine lyase/cysteine desulfurase
MLLTENDFPSMGFVMDHAAPAGTVARFIGADEDPTDIGTWERHLGDDVWLVFITHVQSNTGLATPVGEITALARERGIVSIVDVAQSAGVIPIDLQTWQADFLIGSCVKWLCGGPGAGFLWLSEEMAATAEPVDIGWFSHASPFEFDIHQFRYADSALRFWGGTPSVAPFVIGANAIAQLSGHGIDRIRRHNLQLCRLLMEAADGRCLVSPTDDDRRGGTVVVRLPEDPQARLVEALTEAGIAFDGRASGIRLSPHIYNTMAEVEAAADIIRGLANL